MTSWTSLWLDLILKDSWMFYKRWLALSQVAWGSWLYPRKNRSSWSEHIGLVQQFVILYAHYIFWYGVFYSGRYDQKGFQRSHKASQKVSRHDTMDFFRCKFPEDRPGGSQRKGFQRVVPTPSNSDGLPGTSHAKYRIRLEPRSKAIRKQRATATRITFCLDKQLDYASQLVAWWKTCLMQISWMQHNATCLEML